MARRILITGAGRRLGKQLAEHWLQQGWQVVAHFNSECQLQPNSNLTCLQADLSCPDDSQRLCDQLADTRLFDGVIFNASCFIDDASADDLVEHMQRHFHVHVLAPMLIMNALDNHWANGAFASVITDIYADVPNERFATYCASKAALQNWSLSMAQRLAGRVRVNVIQPGPIQFLPEHSDEYRQRVLSQSLIKQELGYDSIVQACEYLAQATAVTGSIMRVDGGRFVANRYDQTFVD